MHKTPNLIRLRQAGVVLDGDLLGLFQVLLSPLGVLGLRDNHDRVAFVSADIPS